jgi:hypothetical protein
LDLADLRSVLNDEKVYNEAASEAFPLYNKSHLICLELPNRSGDVSLFFLLNFGIISWNVSVLVKLWASI